MTFSIREIVPSDNVHLADIIRKGLIEYGANRPGFAWSDPELDALSEAYRDEAAVYYVVAQGQKVFGGGGIAPFPCEYPRICELQKMYLAPQARGKGMGNILMQKLLAAAQEFDYAGCYLETLNAMKPAAALYQKSGFEPLAKPLGSSGHTSCNRFYIKWFEAPTVT